MVVAISDSTVVCKELFLSRLVVDGETRIFCGELIFLASKRSDRAFVISKRIRLSWTINFAPRFAFVGGLVDVLEDCRRHV